MKRKVNSIPLLLAISFPCFAFTSNSNDVELIENARGIESCPGNTLCLYTNIDYNEGELGDILAIKPNIQLNSDDLNAFGFPVGAHDGVSSVVNKMSIEGTLVRGENLNGDFLSVAANQNISSLVNYHWNDSANSVITQKVTPVNLSLSLPDKTIHINSDDSYSTLTVSNSSDEDIDLEMAVEGTQGILTVLDYAHHFTVPSRSFVNQDILLSGERLGDASIERQLA